MSADTSIPLTPPDCDLRDFAFMPLEVARLRDSDLALEESPAVCWAAVLLWSASWHQVPSASLPDSDKALAKFTNLQIDEWLLIRDRALRGFVKCSDGRLYHTVVAAKARESWRGKLKHAYDKLADRIRKANKLLAEARQAEVAMPSFDRWLSIGRPMDGDLLPDKFHRKSTGSPPERGDGSDGSLSKTPLKGEGHGEGQGEGEGDLKANAASALGGREDDSDAGIARPRARPAQLSAAMRVHGIQSGPADPRIVEAAEAGVTPELVDAACTHAKTKKPGENIPAGYVLTIARGWMQDASAAKAAGVAPISGARLNSQEMLEANNRRIAEELAEERRHAREG